MFPARSLWDTVKLSRIIVCLYDFVIWTLSFELFPVWAFVSFGFARTLPLLVSVMFCSLKLSNFICRNPVSCVWAENF